MRTFFLERIEDETGISGTGIVAEGVEFSDGQIAMNWIVGDFRSVVIWRQGISAVEAIHGHNGKTKVVWKD